MGNPVEHVTLFHPETGHTWDCPVAAVEHFVNDRGWQRQDQPKQAAKARAEKQEG